MGFSFFVLGYITKSTVMICPSVKICDFLGFFFFFFFNIGAYWHVHRVRERSEKKKKGHRLDTGVWRVVPVSVSDTCRTLVHHQKWRVGAT